MESSTDYNLIYKVIWEISHLTRVIANQTAGWQAKWSNLKKTASIVLTGLFRSDFLVGL